MPTLFDIDGASLAVDPNPALNIIRETFGTRRERDAREEQRALTEKIADPNISAQELESNLIRLSKVNAPAAQAISGILQRGDEREEIEAQNQIRESLVLATQLKQAQDFGEQQRILKEIGETKAGRGEDLGRVIELSKMDRGRLGVEIDRMILAGTISKDLLELPKKQRQERLIEDARLASDILNTPPEQQPTKMKVLMEQAIRGGFPKRANKLSELLNTPLPDRGVILRDIINKAPLSKIQAFKAGDTGVDAFGNVVFQSPLGEAGGVDFAKPAVKDFTPESIAKAISKGGDENDLVIRPEALAKLGGSDAFKIGREVKIRVGDKEFFVTPVTQRNKAGKVVTVGNLTPIVGPDEGKPVDFISPLGETGVQETSRKVGEGTELAQRKQSLVISKEAFDKILPIDKSLQAIDEGIAAIEAGANTGPIISQLPSITQASVTLDNVQARMGLNVIQSTTFGSLSESELKFALSAALPQSLQPDALKDWLIRKRDVQTKLRDYLRGAASFFGQGGTIKEFNDQQKQLQKLRESQTQAAPVAPQGELNGSQKSRLEQLRQKQGR